MESQLLGVMSFLGLLSMIFHVCSKDLISSILSLSIMHP